MTHQNLEDIYFPVKHGKHAFAEHLRDITTHRFPATPTFLQGFIAQDLPGGNGAKQYVTTSNFPAWLQTDVIDSQENRCLYEVIPVGNPVRPYFDIEFDPEQLDEKQTMDRVFHVLSACFQTLGVELRLEDVTLFCASGACSKDKVPSGWKASFHLILRTNQVFQSVADHKAFITQIVFPYIASDPDMLETMYWTDAKGLPRCVIDHVPYSSNQTFRLPYQSKMGSDRTFVPCLTLPTTIYCIGLYCPVEELSFISLPSSTTSPRDLLRSVGHGQTVPTRSPEFELVQALCDLLSVVFITDYEKALHLILCLCGVEHSERMVGLIHQVCSRASNYEYRWVQTTIQGFRYKGFSLSHLVGWATACSSKETVSKVMKQCPVNYSHELFTEHMRPAHTTQINERYLSESPVLQDPFGESDTLIVKSLLGTGKTVFIKQCIVAKGQFERILIVSPRKSYTHAQKGAFTNDASVPEFTSYLDIFYGDLAHLNHMIIQVESLHRIGNMFQKYDLVLLDEVESILNQLHSVKTNAGNLITNHEVLALAVSTARYVVMADAFISDRTFYFCKELRNMDKTHYVENMCNPYQRQAVFLAPLPDKRCVANLGGFCERVCDALRAGRRIVIVWTSKRKGDWFVTNFLEKWKEGGETGKKPSWLFYNSTSSKEEQDGLRDVDKTWRDVQCLMMTTSITVGISYDPKVAEAEFDEAFLYGSAASAMPRDIAQALFRVRCLKANRLTYVIDSRGAFPSGSRGFANIWNEVLWKESKLVRNHPIVKWTTCPQWARYNFVYCENEERNSRVEYKTILEEYLVRSGYTLREEVHIPSQAVANIPLELDNGDSLFWANIDDVSLDAAFDIQGLMKRGEASAEEILQYKKSTFRSQFVTTCEEADLERWWNMFYTTDSERCFWNIVKEKRWTTDDVAHSQAIKRYAIMADNSVKERETLERFLVIVGMTHSQEEVVLSAEKLETVGAELSKVEKELRKGMGLRETRRKGEWSIKNTIDLITVVLESWGRSRVEVLEKRHRTNGKIVREYTIQINKHNTIWNNIYNSNANLGDFSFNLSG